MKYTLAETDVDGVDERMLLYLTEKYDNDSISNQVGKEPFDVYIHNLLKQNCGISLQTVNFELDPSLPPTKCLEIVTNIIDVLRREIFQNHLIAVKEVEFRHRVIVLCLHYQSNQLKALEFQKSQVEKQARAIDTKCKQIINKHDDFESRLNKLLQKCAQNTSLSGAEVRTNIELKHAICNVNTLKEKLKDLNVKANCHLLQIRKNKELEPQQSSSLFIKDYQKKNIVSCLKKMEEDIVNLTHRVKMVQSQARNSVVS